MCEEPAEPEHGSGPAPAAESAQDDQNSAEAANAHASPTQLTSPLGVPISMTTLDVRATEKKKEGERREEEERRRKKRKRKKKGGGQSE